MKIILFKSSFLFFLCANISCASKNKKTEKKADLRYQMAFSYMQKCDYPAALAELKIALNLKNQDPKIHYSIALLYFQFKKYNLTVNHLKKALKLQPKFTDARVQLGRTLIEIGKIEKGLSELNKAREDLTYRHPEKIHSYQGLAYYKEKKYPEAEEQFSVARVVKKKDCYTALYHAKSLYFQNKLKPALRLLESTKNWCAKKVKSSCSPPSYEAYYFTGLIHKKTGQRNQALLNLVQFVNKTKESEYLESARKILKKQRGLK